MAPQRVQLATPEPKALSLAPKDRRTELISFVSILANPAALHDRPVSITGYLHLEFEGDSLCMHREDFERSLRGNCLWIDLSPTPEAMALSDRYVSVQGFVDATSKGHDDMYLATIGRVMSVHPVFSRQEALALVKKPMDDGAQ